MSAGTDSLAELMLYANYTPKIIKLRKIHQQSKEIQDFYLKKAEEKRKRKLLKRGE